MTPPDDQDIFNPQPRPELVELKRLADLPPIGFIATCRFKTAEEAIAWGAQLKAVRVYTYCHKLGYMTTWAEMP